MAGTKYTPLSNVNRSGPTGDPDFNRARNIVDIEYDPQRNQLQRNIDQMLRQRNQEINTQQEYGVRGDQALQSLYGQLYGNLEQGIDRTQNLYNAGVEQVGGFYDRANSDLQSATGKVQQSTNHEAARLGIEAGTPAVNQKYNDTLLQGMSRNLSSRAGAQGNVAARGVDMTALAVGGLGAAQREGTNERSTLLNNVQRAIADTNLQAGEGIYDAFGSLADIEGVRGKALAKAYQDVFEARNDRERQNRLDNLAEEIQRNTMNLQNQEFQMGVQNQNFNQSQTSTNSAFERQLAQAANSRAEQELQLARRQAEFEMQQARTAAQQQAAAQRIQQIDSQIARSRSPRANAVGTRPGFQEF